MALAARAKLRSKSACPKGRREMDEECRSEAEAKAKGGQEWREKEEEQEGEEEEQSGGTMGSRNEGNHFNERQRSSLALVLFLASSGEKNCNRRPRESSHALVASSGPGDNWARRAAQ